MKKMIRLVAFILVAVLTVTYMPVSAMASGTEQAGNEYAVSLTVELKEWKHSLSVNVNAYSLGSDTTGGKLIVTLYENDNGIQRMCDLFTADIQSGVLANTPDVPEASGVLNFGDADTDKLFVSAVICRSLDNPLPLSASVNCEANDFVVVPASVSTLKATDVTKTSVVLHGKIEVEAGTALNVADFGFIVIDVLDGQTEIFDEDGNPIGVIPPAVQPAQAITADGSFSLSLTDLEPGTELQYMAVSIEKVPVYGEPMSVTVLSDKPVVETNAAPYFYEEYADSAVKLQGMITDAKGLDITESGVMFGTDPYSAPNEKAYNQSGLGGGDITSYLASLERGITYYYRAYAINSAGIGYGKIYNFTRPAIAPVIQGISASFDPETWKATVSAESVINGGKVIERGFRYKSESATEWKYCPIDTESIVFEMEIEGQVELPVGRYDVEAYITTAAGTGTKAIKLYTGFLYGVAASVDKASITVSSAMIKGVITPYDLFGSQQIGFEYKAISDSSWLEVGLETGTFGLLGNTDDYSFELQGLKPYTEYEFRAKALSYAGWSYSSAVTFTTIFSDNSRQTAYQMRMDGKTGLEIAEILKNNLKLTVSEAYESLKFAGFNAYDIAAALKAAPYNATYDECTAGLKSVGFDACTVASVLQTHYADVYAYIGGDIITHIFDTLSAHGYSVDDRIKVAREMYNKNMLLCSAYLDVDIEVVFSSLIRMYGVSDFSVFYWAEYNALSNPTWYMGKLTEILKNNTSLSAGEIAALLKKVYPEMTVAQFISTCREFYPAVNDMVDAVMQGIGADPLMLAEEMMIYYSLDDIKTWLIGKYRLNAVQMVKIMMELTDPLSTVPSLLKEDFGITSAADAAKVMYTAGWKEDEITAYNYWRVLKLLKDDFGSTSSDLIDIMKNLGFSPLTIAKQMEAADWAIFAYQSEWIAAYKAQGYTASDLAVWCKTTEDYANVTQTIFVLGNAGYSLNEIVAALKQIYLSDASSALTILRYDAFTVGSNMFWSKEDVTAAVDLAYSVNSLDTVVAQMKTDGASAVQITGTLKETFAVTEPSDVADYLTELEYTMTDVLNALAQNFRTKKNAELITMLSQILKDKFNQEPTDNIELILTLYESVKEKLNHASNAAILLHNSGFSLTEITYALKNDIDALQNIATNLTAIEAGQLLLGLASYGLTYDKLEVFAVVDEVYGVNFMQDTVIDFKNNKHYSAKTAIDKLYEDFGVDTPSAAALCLKTAGYSMVEVLDGLAQRYQEEKLVGKTELLEQVIKDVYPDVQARIKTVMETMYITSPGLAADTLYQAGYSVTDIADVLKNEYGLSSGQATELLYERNFDEITVSLQEVYGGDSYLDFILYRKSQGDGLSKLFNWLNKKFAIDDISRIMEILKLAGFTSAEIISLLYEERQDSNDETILQIQDVFGINSISSFVADRKSKGDSISQVFYWMQKFGVKKIDDIKGYLYAAGYSETELIEYLFSSEMKNKITIEAETTFGKNAIVTFLNGKKALGEGMERLYVWLTEQFVITNIDQIVNYFKAVGYTSVEIISFLHRQINDSTRNAEILAAVQAASGGTDVITELLKEKKNEGETITLLYNRLKDKFNVTDMTQTVAYLKAAGCAINEIMAFLYLHVNDSTRYAEILAAVQASSGGTDVITELLKEKKNEGETIAQLYNRLKDKFNVTDMTQTVAYLKAAGCTINEIMAFLYQNINDSTRYAEILTAVQAANAAMGKDTVLEFLIERKTNGDTISALLGWLTEKFNIYKIEPVVSYLKALDYTNNEIISAWCELNGGTQEQYEDVIQAIQAASNTDVVLDFLKEKKALGEGLIQLYISLTEQFGIEDINKLASYFSALGYGSNEILQFLYVQYSGLGRNAEISAAVQAAQASSGVDVIPEFLKSKKNEEDWDITNLYISLTEQFGIDDINKLASYFSALGYSGNEILQFLYMQYSGLGRNTEISAAVQAAQASSGFDVILEFLKSKKNEEDWNIANLYISLTEQFGIDDINKLASYFSALGYSGNEILQFLYTQYSGLGRNAEILAAVQAAQASSGFDVIPEFLKNQMNDGGWTITNIYISLTEQFGIEDINKIVSYLTALDYNSNEILQFLYAQYYGLGRNAEILAAVQVAQESSGSDVILNYLKNKKNEEDWDIETAHNWLTTQAGVNDIIKILNYYKELGYSSNTVVDFANTLNEHLISSSQNNSSDDSVIEMLTYRKSQGGSLEEHYALLQEVNIIEIGQITSYFKAVGFSDAEATEFFDKKGINRTNQVYHLIESVYDDVRTDYLVYVKKQGYDVSVCLRILTDKFGSISVSQNARYLKNIGYTDSEIVDAFNSGGKQQAVAALKALYPTETMRQIADRLWAAGGNAFYSINQRVIAFKEAFPSAKYSDIILMIRDLGEKVENIFIWMTRINREGLLGSVQETKIAMDELTSILGSRNQNDLHMSCRDVGDIFTDFGFSADRAIDMAKYNCYSNFEIYRILKEVCGYNELSDRQKIAKAMNDAGFTLSEIAEALITHYKGDYPPDYWDPRLAENPYSTARFALMDLMDLGGITLSQATDALVEGGIAPRYLLYTLFSYWQDRFYWPSHNSPEQQARFDSHYPHLNSEFSFTTYVDWVYNAIEKLPIAKRNTIDVVEEVAAGLFTITKYMENYAEVFDAMLYVTSKISYEWRLKIEDADIDALDDMVNTIVSLVSLPGTGAADGVLHLVMVVNAMRTAGYTNDQATALLKSVVDENYMMNFAMQVVGGYNVFDSWSAILRDESYRLLLTISVCWTIALTAYRYDAFYKVLKSVKDNYGRVKKICKFLIKHDIILTSAPARMSLIPYSESGGMMLLNSPSTAEISDVSIATGENGAVTVRGNVSSGANNQLILLVKKPDVNGISQKDIQLDSLTDQELMNVIEFFGCVNSTEPVSADGTSYNFDFQYRSNGAVGQYSILIGAAGVAESYRADAVLFAKVLDGSVSIIGPAKFDEILTADISGLINAEGTLSYQWYRAGVAIEGANSSTYTTLADDIGKTVTVKVSADGIAVTGSITSSATEVIAETGEIDTVFYGNGTQDNPYLVRNSAELAGLAQNVNEGNTYQGKYFKLTSDIILNDTTDLESWATSAPANSWTPIGTVVGDETVKSFDGDFDGDGHTVSGLYISDTTVGYSGLFGYMGTNGIVRNLSVTSSYISTEGFGGGVCGYNMGTITNCFSTGTITGSVGNASVGGICGYNSGTIENCYYLDTDETDSYAGTTFKTAEEFENGTVAYALNGGITDGTQVWYQNIDNGNTKDLIPKFNGGTVYFSYKNCASTAKEYSNSDLSEKPEHNYNEWSDNADGNHKRTCTLCNTTETQAHTYGEYGDNADGTHKRTCAVCNNTETQSHTYGEWSDNGNGTHTSICTACNNTETQSHTYGEWSDNGNGTHTSICTACNTTETKAHTYGEWSDNGNGTHTSICTACSSAETQSHTYGDWSDNGDGKHKRTCTVCSSIKTEAHTYIEGGYIDYGDGTHESYCYTCYSYQRQAHVYTEFYDVGDGSHMCLCVCGSYKTQSHAWVVETETPANCHQKGSVHSVCSTCSATQDKELAINPDNHHGSTEIRNAVSATAESEGYTGDTYCLGCEALISEGTVIQKLQTTTLSELLPDFAEIQDGIVTGIDEQTTAGDIIADGIKIYGIDGNELSSDAYIGTGCVIRRVDSQGNVQEEAVASVLGDLDGNGEISTFDAVQLLKVVAELFAPSDAQAIASDIDVSSDRTPYDAVVLLQYIAGIRAEI